MSSTDPCADIDRNFTVLFQAREMFWNLVRSGENIQIVWIFTFNWVSVSIKTNLPGERIYLTSSGVLWTRAWKVVLLPGSVLVAGSHGEAPSFLPNNCPPGIADRDPYTFQALSLDIFQWIIKRERAFLHVSNWKQYKMMDTFTDLSCSPESNNVNQVYSLVYRLLGTT